MLKNFTMNVLPFALIAAIGLSGCASTTGTTAATNATTLTNTVLSTATTVAPLTNTSTQTTINTIIADTKLACGFIPASLSVASLLTANTGITTASGIVSAICNSVTAAKSSAARKPFGVRKHKFGAGMTAIVLVDGVVVKGEFAN